MVNEQANVKVTLNSQSAQKELSDLQGQMKRLIALKTKAEKEGDTKGWQKINGELKKVNRQANKLVRENQSIEKTLKNINGASLNDLQKAQRKLNREMAKMDRNSQEYKKAAKNASLLNTEIKKARVETGQWRSPMQKMLGQAKALLPAFSIGAIVAGISRLGKELFSLTKTIQGETIRSTVVLGNQLESVENQAEKLAAKMGVTNREFVSMVANTADLLIPLDFSRESAAKMATEVQGLAGAMDEWTAGKYGVAEVSNILTKAMLGEMEQLKGLGIAIKMDSEEYRNLVKQKIEDENVTKAQAQAMATLELLYKKSADAQSAYEKEGNKLLRAQKSISLWWKKMKENAVDYFMENQAEQLRKEQEQVNGLVIQLQSANIEEENRAILLERLKRIAPDLAKTINDEKTSIEDLTQALAAYNDEMALKILIAEGDEDIAKQKSKVEAFRKLSAKAQAELAKELKHSIDGFEKKAPGVKQTAEEILFDTQKSVQEKAEQLNSLALKNTTLGNASLFHALDSYRIFKKNYADELFSLNLLIAETEKVREEWQTIFGREEEKVENNEKEEKVKKSLIEIQEKLLEQAKEMPEATEAEIITKNKKIEAIEKEIKRLKDLGVTSKETFDLSALLEANAEQQKAAIKEYFSEAGEEATDAFLNAVEKSMAGKNIDFSMVPDKPEEQEEKDPALDYAMQQYQETLEYKQLLLEAQYENDIIAEQEYQDRLTELNRQGENTRFNEKMRYADKARQLSDMGVNFVMSLMELELAKAGENEKKKAAIRKKYANMQFMVTASQIVVDTAAAVMKALAQLGPIAGPIAAAIVGATGAAQLAIANAEREKMVGFATGGYTPPGGEMEPAGIVHAGEWVAPKWMVKDKQAGPIISMLEAQREQPFNKKIDGISQRHLKLNMQEIIPAIQFASGGYTSLGQKMSNRNNTPIIPGIHNWQGPAIDKKQNEILTALVSRIGGSLDANTAALKDLKNAKENPPALPIDKFERERNKYLKIQQTSGL